MNTIRIAFSLLLLITFANLCPGQTSGVRFGDHPIIRNHSVYPEVVPLPNGESFQFLSGLSYPDTVGFFVGRFDADGAPLSVKEVRVVLPPNNFSLAKISVASALYTSAGEIAACGLARGPSPSQDIIPYLAFFDPQTLNLNQLFTLQGWNGNLNVSQVIEASNGDFYISGGTSDLHQPSSGMVICRLNRNNLANPIVFSHQYDVPAAHFTFKTGIHEISSNNFIFMGETKDTLVTPAGRKRVMFSIDANGQVNWAKKYTSDGIWDFNFEIHRTDANRLVVMTNAYLAWPGPSPQSARSAIFLEIDTLGNPLQGKIVPDLAIENTIQRDSLITGLINILAPTNYHKLHLGVLTFHEDGTLLPGKLYGLADEFTAYTSLANADLFLRSPGHLGIVGGLRVATPGILDSVNTYYRLNLDAADGLPCYARDTVLQAYNYAIVDTAFTLTYTSVATSQDSFTANYGNHTPFFRDSILCQSDCVWPGDANNDGTANNNDLLKIGLGYGATGTARAQVSNDWACQPATDWPQVFQGGLPYQHADCNGDGIINDNDTLAIQQNYGLVHNKTGGLQGTATSPPLYLDWGPDSSSVGDTAWADILLGTQALPVDSLYGIAFSITYDNSLVDTNSAYIVFDSSWLGHPGNTLTLQRDFWAQGYIDGAITRTDGENASGYGHIARLHIVLIDNIEGKRAASELLNINFSRYEAVTAHEEQLALQTAGDDLLVTGLPTSAPPSVTPTAAVRVFPNPGTGLFQIQYESVNLTALRVYDLTGKVLAEIPQPASGSQIDLRAFPDGIYILQTITKDQVYNQKLILQH